MNSVRWYCVKKLAILVVNEPDENSTTDFVYKEKTYAKIFNFCENELLFDVNRNNDFQIREDTFEENTNNSVENVTYLCLFFIPNQSIRRRIKCNKSRIRLISLFTNNEELDSEIIEPTSSENDYTITTTLYKQLMECHVNDQFSKEIPIDVQHDSLRPTLRGYQSKAVRWLLHREKCKEVLWHGFKEVDCSEVPDTKFYLNVHNLELTDVEPKSINVPSGGILADEMGLGKTIEILDLILLNPKPEDPESDTNGTRLIDEPTLKHRKFDNDNFLCICIGSRHAKKLIRCTICRVLQHQKCVRKYTIVDNQPHICPKCWENESIIPSGATVIVTPSTIIRQWYLEIKKHSSSSLKVLLYKGVQHEWISPKELASYDIILADYNMLKREIYFSSTNETHCQFRTSKKYMRTNSPLRMVFWWRVCLDEAQMVESSNAHAAKMVQTLHTTYRWAVTGTPIQKSINDLKEILDFLNFYPVSEDIYWNSLVSKYKRGDTKPLLDILHKVMWRNCKEFVVKELDIPGQVEKIHFIEMTDVEKLFYRGQHSVCAENFNDGIDKFMCHKSQISKINPSLLKKILEPLKKLRQDCTVPVLCQKIQQNVVKKLLKPQELLDHLRSTNEIECKAQLRTMASSYNGKAGIFILQKQYEEAIKMYETVLNLSKQYNDKISVDSLLQIHALYNLFVAHKMNDTVPNANDYTENMLSKLEWHYIDPYYKILIEADTIYKDSKTRSTEISDTSSLHICSWLSILKNVESLNQSEQLIFKINDEKNNSFPLSMYNEFTHVSGIQYLLTTWFDTLTSTRDDVLKGFITLHEFVQRVKERRDVSSPGSEEIHEFVHMAFVCHLNILRNGKSSKVNVEPKCDLCKVKRFLNNYECLIFNKTFVGDTELTEGSWNPSYQEVILKEILNFAKSKAVSTQHITTCTKTLNLIDYMKKEYKDLIKLWIEIEFTVKAYDELDMCKLRLDAIDPSEEDETGKSNYKISKFDLEENFSELDYQLEMSQVEFARKLARLKYINHLEKKDDPGSCPICKQEPESKYTVLQCGHHLCTMCFIGMSHYQKNILTCAICRNQQRYEDVYHVTRQIIRSVDDVEIVGHYSSKIEKILYIILNLKRQQEGVKILIFSQWSPILQVIANALKDNDIVYRSRCTTKSIDEFKDGNLKVTCLLLLLADGSKGLNLIEATHVILVEPILNPGEELQAIGRVHRIGQTRETTIHRMILKDTIEDKIFATISKDNWKFENVSVENLKVLFSLDS